MVTSVTSLPGFGGGGTRISLLPKGFKWMLLPVCGLVCGNKSLCSLTIRGKPHNCEGGEMIYRISIHFLTIRRKTCAHRKNAQGLHTPG